ncbi:hypothetical protein E3E31_08905 [Thermococcus sp. M39]|uniref:hypothetical protein n=1 Tax=Thermococcus sp. M39 TaxID=1638262 RepID=UPI00143BD907|nr:hypothetical protein [Thermococcus sp. M39]NJE08636.1 hypothetical protein [Thermococcus sp. M39]
MRIYTFGKETVPVAGVSMEDGILIIGSVRNENYKIMLLNLIIGMNALQALGLALYMGSVVLAMYYVAYHTGSLKVPIIAWMLLMVA